MSDAITVSAGDPREPQCTALLQQSHALMMALFAKGECHFLSIDALCIPTIRFYVARQGDRVLGCGALANKATYGEVKSLFVLPEARGTGVASRLLNHIEQQARTQGLQIIKLETGDKLNAARQFYVRHGYSRCDAFGDYSAVAVSVFMEKPL